MSDYKYTELRQFLLYTGKLLLLDIPSSLEVYKVFLTYSITSCLVVDSEKSIPFCRVHCMLMNKVVVGFSEIFGEYSQELNHVQDTHWYIRSNQLIMEVKTSHVILEL